MKLIFCNTRNLYNSLTGVQRYTAEILNQLQRSHKFIEHIYPQNPISGFNGHAWEQFVLPCRLKRNLLWSPSNTGPLLVENQVLSLLDCSAIDHPEWSSKKFSSWYQFLLPRLVKKVRKIITISEFSKSRIVELWPEVESKVEVTLLAANDLFVPSDEFLINSMISRLGIPSRRYVVALGSIEPRKNLRSLLLAWERISLEIPDDVWLVIAGGAGKRLVFGHQALKKLPPRVFLTGRVDDDLLPPLYTGAIASVYLSLYEGFGLPPLESMACGTPVIASNTSSIPEVVGGAAILVDPLDIDAISYQLIRVIQNGDLRGQMSKSSLLRAREFSWRNTALQTFTILNGAANQ